MKTDLFLFLYSIAKAFLPLPSLEAVLVPLALAQPSRSLLLSLISGAGTLVGGAVGYGIAYAAGRKTVLKWVSEQTLAQGERMLEKYGALAIIVGSITPFPDFILAYLAGLCKMNLGLFLLLDGICRMIRSLLVTYSISRMSQLLQMEKYVTWIVVLLLAYFAIKYLFQKKRQD